MNLSPGFSILKLYDIKEAPTSPKSLLKSPAFQHMLSVQINPQQVFLATLRMHIEKLELLKMSIVPQ